jgi:hypothetical protein
LNGEMVTFFDLGIDPDVDPRIKLTPLDGTFFRAYPSLLAFFDKARPFTGDDFVCAAHMVYGWMPRILRLHDTMSFDEAAGIVEATRSTGQIDDKDLGRLVSLIDNSIVAVSKLLHFARPDAFGIWDSRVQRFLANSRSEAVPGGDPATWRRSRGVATYRAYLDLLGRLTADPRFPRLHQRVEARMPSSISAYRAAELVMYTHGA